MQRRFQFLGIFLETLAVEGVAMGEVLAQHPCDPLAEAGGMSGVDAGAHGDDGIKVPNNSAICACDSQTVSLSRCTCMGWPTASN